MHATAGERVTVSRPQLLSDRRQEPLTCERADNSSIGRLIIAVVRRRSRGVRLRSGRVARAAVAAAGRGCAIPVAAGRCCNKTLVRVLSVQHSHCARHTPGRRCRYAQLHGAFTPLSHHMELSSSSAALASSAWADLVESAPGAAAALLLRRPRGGAAPTTLLPAIGVRGAAVAPAAEGALAASAPLCCDEACCPMWRTALQGRRCTNQHVCSSGTRGWCGVV